MPASDYQKSLDAQYEDDLRESQRQLAEAEREATRQQKEQAQQQKESAKEQQRQSNNIKEADFRAQKRPQYVDAYGDIQPTHSDEEWQQQQETARTNATAHDEAATSGRKFTTSKVTGSPIYLESEQAVEARRQAAAEALRRTSLDKQLKANQAEFEYQKQSGGLPKLLTDRQKKKLTEEHQAARFGLAGALDAKTKEVTGGNDYIPWNEAPSADALKAKERQAKLTAPDTAQLSEDDLAEFDGNDATKPHAAKIRNIQSLLSKDASARELQQTHAQRQADLVLRRDAPDKWEALQKQKLATMSPDELQTHLAGSGESINARQQQLQEAYAPLTARQQATESQLAALTAENEQRRKEGIPAGELVSFEGDNGQPDHWAKDLAAKRETLITQHQQAQQDAAPVLDDLQTQHDALQKDIELHNEGTQLLQAGQTAAAAEQKQADLSHLKFTPGHEQTAQEIESLDSEAQTRLADLNTVWEGNPPPEAVQAIQQDVAQRSQGALAMGDARRLAAQSAYAGIQQQVQEYQNDPQKKGDVGDLWINARKNLAEALNIPEAKAHQLLEDVEAEHDWDKVLGRFQEETPATQWKSWRNAMSDDSDPRKTRLLSNGGIVVNPSITDEAKYKAAVEEAKASPEAKTAAVARYPQIRQRAGQNVLDTLQEIEGTFGKDTLKPWEAFSKQRPKDVSEQDWALKFSEKLKTDTAATPWTSLLKQVSRSGAQGLYDLRQQGSGFIAGLTGSQTAMQDAQWAGRKAAALGATKELEGTVGQNFASRGVLDQLPRLAGSILPAAGGAKAAQFGIRLFAATGLGARILPSLAAAMESAATPAQAVRAVQTLTRAGLGGAAAAGALQTYGSQLADIYGTLRREDPSLTHQQALSAAQQPAILSAAVTALLTTAGGAHGLEKLLVSPAAAREVFKKRFTSQLQRAGFLGAAFAKGAGKELLEELPDELFSQYQAAVASHPKDPQAGTKAITQFMKQLPELSVAIGLLGGGGESVSDSQGTSIQHPASSNPATLPETQSAAWSAIQNHRHLDANGVETPEFTQATQQRAALALATAQGGDLADATEQQLNASGWTRRDSQGRDMPQGKFARLKDYTGPNVLNIDTTGHAHVDPSYHTSLKENLPAVAAAIPDEATRPAPLEQPATAGNPPAGQTPANGPGPNANPSPVQTPAQSGTQPPPSGNSPAQSGTPVTSGNSDTPVQNSGSSSDKQSSTAVPDTQQSIANFLQERGMPAAEAQSASVAIAQHPAMAGQDYDYFHKEPILRSQLLSDLGITGSQNSKESATNPLRYSSASPASGNSANSINPVQTSSSGPSENVKSSPSKESSSEESTVNNGQQTSPPLPPSVQAALDDSIPGTPSQEVFTAIKKAVQAKELTEQQATTLVAQQSGALDHTELRQSLENKLGWNPTRANTAAALHFGDKSQSPIPLAAALRTQGEGAERSETDDRREPAGKQSASVAKPIPDSGNPVNSVNPVQNSSSDNPPSSLRANPDYATARLAALARIKDPAKKAWTRQFLDAFEKSFERHHLLYDAIGTGPVARKLLGGNFTAVMDLGGKITRLIDLDAMASQFDYLQTPAAAVAATGIEEDVHALVLRLARENPSKYGRPALIKQWKSLPPALQQTVWQAYNAASASPISHLPSAISSLSETQQWHLMNEFLRMLVQDARFAGQITETVDAQPSLLQWLKDFLKDLGQTLRSLIAKAPPALAKDLASMVADIGQRLTTIEGRSTSTTARLESLTSLRDPAAAARQTLAALGSTTPIFSPAALERIFNQMPAALQKQTFHQWQQSQPAEKPAKASKADLMRFLLGQMLADPSLATSTLLLAEAPATTLLAKVLQKLSTLTQGEGVANSLRSLHVATLRALGGLHGMAFVQRLSPAQQQLYTAALAPVQPQSSTASPPPTAPTGRAADMLAALEALEQDHQQASTPAAALRLREKLRQQEIAQNRALFFAQDNAARALQQEASPDRGADMLAALQAHEDALALDHQQASTPAAAALLRTKLGLQRVARNRSRFFLRDNAARELHAAEQAGRQDLPKAQSLLALALGHIGSRRAASGWRTLGIPERRQLALLGIGVDQHPHTETGGYVYSLARIETAEARVEFSLAGTAENQMAQEELDWMRQQAAEYQTKVDPLSPAYVEENHVIIKQSALDGLSLSYPHTAALIRPEWHTRQSYGLRVDARSAQVKQALLPAPPEERQSNTQQPELPTSAPSPTSGNSANSVSQAPARQTATGSPQGEDGNRLVNPVQNSGSGSGIPLLSIPLPKTSGTVSPTPPSLSFPIPLSKRGQVRRSTFPDAESLAAFQFKLDADTASAARSTALEVKKAEQRALALLARLMEDSPLTRTELEQKLLDYHRTLVQQAESASAFGTFVPPAFHTFASNGGISAPSGNLPAPEGGDILAAMRAQGIRRLGPPDSSDGWSWYRSLQQDASTSKLKNAEAQRLARAGDLTDPKARLFWLNENVVSLTSGRSIDEAATELSESEDQSFPVGTGDELGQAILSALDARIQAAQNPASSIEDQESSSRESAADFATYAAGTPGQPFTAAELAKELQPEDEIQIGSEYLTVLEADPASGSITLDSSRFGPVTLTGTQILHLTSGPNHLRIARPEKSSSSSYSNSSSERSDSAAASQSPASQEALRNAHSPSYKPDLLKPSPIESTLRDGPLPTATPQDTAALDRDYHASIAAGEALDQSTPDLDLEDDIADSADAYLDGELLPAAARSAPSEASAKDGPASKFYSALARAIESKMPARSTPATVVGILKNAGIKTEELKWTGILPWLQQQAQNGPITQQQVLDYLANEGAVLLQEVRLGGSQTNLEDANRAVIAQAQSEGMTKSGAEDYALSAARGDLSPGQLSFISPAMRPLVARLRASYEARASEYAAGQSQPKYSQYQLPGGTNYREVVLTMPGKEDRTKIPEGYQLVEGTGLKKWEVYGPGTGRYAAGQTTSEAIENFWDLHGKHHDLHAYTSSHFQYIPNYVAHMRLNDRTDAEGKDGTFIEEIQSDRHQAGREKGYIGDQAFSARPDGIGGFSVADQEGRSVVDHTTNMLISADTPEQALAIAKERGRVMGQPEGVPDAPFRTSWPLQMFKRALVDAVASGKQWIGWTTGDTQAKRYDLSQQVSFIQTEHLEEAEGVHFVDIRMSKGNDVNLEVENGIVREGDAGTTGKPLSDVIGKEMAEKILSVPQGKQHRFSGVDLALGGEGMKGFYDTILPKEIGKYVKQWGEAVKEGSVQSVVKSATPSSMDALLDELDDNGNIKPESYPPLKQTPIWRVDITPQMKAGVEAGQALFAALRTRHDATFSPAIQTPLGSLERYTWQHKLDDVWDNRAGEYQTKRVSDWDKAITNAETGRDIVHHFDVRKPDGTVQTVSLESALGSLSPEQKKSTTSVIKALRRLPMNEALLQDIEAKRTAYLEAWKQAEQEGWKAAPDIQLQDHSFPARAAEGLKEGTIDGQWVANYAPNELPLSAQAIRQAKTRWATAKVEPLKLSYLESNKLDSLPRIIKKDRQTLKDAGVTTNSEALFAAPRRAYESMTFDPPFHTRFGDILSYDWMNQPVGGLSSQRTSDWSRARTNPATGRDIVHHFKVQKPDGIHTVSLETALGQLTEPQRHKLQSLIKSEQRRREEAAAGQMTLFASQRVTPEQDAEYMAAVESGDVAKQQAMVDAAAKAAGLVKISRVNGDGAPAGFYEHSKAELGTLVPTEGAVRRGNDGTLGELVESLEGVPPMEVEPLVVSEEFDDGTRDVFNGNHRLHVWNDYQVLPKNTEVPILGRVDEGDPITRDAEGNVIPLSQRFNPESNSILFAAQRFDLSRSLAPTTTQSGALTSLFNPRPGAPQNADPRRGYFPSTATPQLLTQAYTAAARGQSSSMLPIRRVFEQAQTLQPSLTPAAFLQAVKSADDSGQVLLEPYDTPAALEAAKPFVLRNASGIPCVSMAVTAALPAAQRVEAAAAETDRNPSAAQKAAGNYSKGKVTLHGLRLSIENPRGSIRSGTDATGKPWSVTMPHHYGYFLGTEGKDGDHVDFFLGPNPDSQQVLIVNQRKTQGAGLGKSPPVSGSGTFDEHKVMLGFDSPAQAAKAYLAAYTPGWKGLQSAIPTTITVLKEWLANHDTTKPVTRESIAKIAQSLPSGNPEIPANFVNPVQPLDFGTLPASPRVESAARALDKSVTTLGQAANLIPKAVGKTLAAITGTGQYIPGNAAMASFGTALGRADAAAAAKVGTTVAEALQRVSGKDIRKAPDAVAAWLGKPDGLGAWTKSVVVDQLLPTALMPREWLALSHEMQRKTAFGAEKSNDLIRALSGNPRLSDLAYPKEFAENMMYREQLFDAMENKIPMSSLPPAMQALAQRLRAMLRETGLELVRQGLMHPDTFEELQSNGWMPRYMLEEAQESAGSLLAAFKLGIQDLRQQRSTAYHIVDTTRRGKDGQHLTVNRQEGGRNAWRFRDAASRDAFYSDFIRQQALEMLQDRHGNTKELQTMLSTLDGQQRREVRSQIQLLTRADMDAPAKLSQALAGMVKQAIELQKAKYKKEAPFDPPKLIKDPVYAIARYILAQTHNAATMELLNETAKNKDWTSNVSLQGFTPIPDQTRFGPLAGKFVQKDIAQQILDKLDVPNAALRFYDAILRKWKSGKLVWNPGSHIRDAVGNTVFAYLGGSSLANPGNWPYYRQAMEIMRHGGPLYAELLEHGVLGGDAYSSLVREKLKGLLPDAKTVENFNPGLLQRFWFDFGSKFNTTHEQLAEYRRMPDDFYKIAAYLKAKDTLTEGSAGTPARSAAAAAHVRKWFPYYDRLGGSSTTRAAGRFVNPFLSFFRESSRILLTAAKERPIALSAALAFPAAISALSAMLLGLDDRDKDEIGKDLAGRGKGILGLSNLHLFSMLLPFRSSQGQVQQWDISSIMPFADLLGQKVVPLEEKENAWQTFWRQTAAAGPIGNLGVSWITNRDLFSGRHLTEADMSTPEMLRAYTQHAAGVALPPLAPDLAAAVGIGDGGTLTKAGQRQVNKTLQTYDPVQTVIRSVFGMNVKSAAPNIYRQAEDFRKAHGYDAQPGFDYGTTVTSRAKRLLVQELAQDAPNPRRITALATRLKALGVPLETSGDIAKVLKIIDPSQIMNGSKKSGLSAEQARQQFRQSLPPESRTLYEASLSEFERIKQKASLLLR